MSASLDLPPSADTRQPLLSPTPVTLLAVLLTLAIIGTEHLGELRAFGLYGLLILAAALIWRAPLWAILRRILQLSPALLLLSLGLPLSRLLDLWIAGSSPDGTSLLAASYWVDALSLFIRSLCALALLVSITQALGWQGILNALRGLGMPLAVTAVLEHMERYRALVTDEWRRTNLARDSRSPGGMRFALASYAGQTGLIFARSWDRSERIHQAMLSRGYSLVPHSMPRRSAWRLLGNVAGLAQLWLPAVALAIRVAL